NSNTPDETTSDTSTTAKPETPIEPDNSVKITIEDLPKYSLVAAARSSNAVMTQFWQLQSQIKKICGKVPAAETDSTKEAEFEILVGATNRAESQAFLANLLWDDYGYAIIGNKLVIAGHTAEGTLSAIKHFMEHIKSGNHKTVFFSNQNQLLYRYPYASDTFMLNGIDVSRASIVVNAKGGDAQIAQTLSDKSLELCGRRPTIVTDEEVVEGSDLIIIGESDHVPSAMQAEWDASFATTAGKSAYYIEKQDNVMWINTTVMEGYGAINRELLPQLQSETATGVTLTTGLVLLPQIFSVMSFNVYVSNFNTQRTNLVVDTILEYAPSVFGVQEASVAWMNALRDRLGTTYGSVGIGRDGVGAGEHSAIFYRKDLFNLIESGTKWLSDTPDEIASKFEEANYPRVMTYAILERKTDGVRFLYVNTHLDHDGKNSPEGAEMVRQRQIEVLLAEIAKLPDLPTIVTGDFNVSPGASAYTTMIEAGFLDSSLVAWAGEPQSTYNGMNDTYAGAIIDYIFVSPDLAEAVDTYMVCPAKRNGNWVSDHNAIIASITLPTK
ncbi:MAG: endonuclease/exonuclease/phosphatase family protein, partial [Clostridia bacterium]|nr:endonuclease/exonuclease/phosphatase family protein [Clostridia bacterium]